MKWCKDVKILDKIQICVLNEHLVLNNKSDLLFISSF